MKWSIPRTLRLPKLSRELRKEIVAKQSRPREAKSQAAVPVEATPVLVDSRPAADILREEAERERIRRDTSLKALIEPSKEVIFRTRSRGFVHLEDLTVEEAQALEARGAMKPEDVDVWMRARGRPDWTM
jgi:hypothetical protein